MAGHSCDMSWSINRDHRYFISKACILFVEEEQNKTRNSYFGAYFSNVSARCNCGKCWPRVPVLPRGSCPAGTLLFVVGGGADGTKNCCPGVQLGSEELGEIPSCLLSCLNAGEVPCDVPKLSPHIPVLLLLS